MLNRLLQLLRRRRLRLSNLAEINVEVHWEREDAIAWAAFLASPTGRKLILSAKHLTVSSAIAAISVGGENLPYKCGQAAGLAQFSGWLDSLAVIKPEAEKQAQGPGDDLDWMRQQTDDKHE